MWSMLSVEAEHSYRRDGFRVITPVPDDLRYGPSLALILLQHGVFPLHGISVDKYLVVDDSTTGLSSFRGVPYLRCAPSIVGCACSAGSATRNGMRKLIILMYNCRGMDKQGFCCARSESEDHHNAVIQPERPYLVPCSDTPNVLEAIHCLHYGAAITRIVVRCYSVSVFLVSLNG